MTVGLQVLKVCNIYQNRISMSAKSLLQCLILKLLLVIMCLLLSHSLLRSKLELHMLRAVIQAFDSFLLSVSQSPHSSATLTVLENYARRCVTKIPRTTSNSGGAGVVKILKHNN